MFLRHFLKVFSDFDINKKKVNNHGLLDQFQTLDILGRDTKHNFLFCSVQTKKYNFSPYNVCSV